MASNYIDSTKGLRDAAWRDVKMSPDYLAFKALDDAVAAMGGDRIIFEAGARTEADRPRASVGTFANIRSTRPVTRLTQAGGAEAALRSNGDPLPIGRLLEEAIKHGAIIGGDKPLANFRSTISKDPRFVSVMRNGMYFWWFKDEALPSGWNEAVGPDLLDGPTASGAHSSQGGGGGHGPATT